MSKSIRISPKHGANPTLGVCFFCGRPTNELTLLGMLKGDKEAPRESVLNYQPCDACLAEWAPGVACIGVTEEQPADKRPPIKKTDTKTLYPTGSFAVLTPDAMARIFDVQAEAGTCIFMDQGIVAQLVQADNKIQNGAEQAAIEVPVVEKDEE